MFRLGLSSDSRVQISLKKEVKHLGNTILSNLTYSHTLSLADVVKDVQSEMSTEYLQRNGLVAGIACQVVDEGNV